VSGYTWIGYDEGQEVVTPPDLVSERNRQTVYANPRAAMSTYATGSTNYRKHGPLLARIDGKEIEIPEQDANEWRRQMQVNVNALSAKLAFWSLKRDPLANAITLALAP
jgi:hypothetical protein